MVISSSSEYRFLHEDPYTSFIFILPMSSMTYRHNHIQHSGIDTWGTGHPGSWSPQAQGHCWGCQESYFTRETRGGDQCQCRCSKCMILLLVITITLHNIKVTKCTATLTPSSPFSNCARFATLSSAACALPTQERWSLLENWNWHSHYSVSCFLCVSYL